MASSLAQNHSQVLTARSNSFKAQHAPGTRPTPSAVHCLRTALTGAQLRLSSSQQATRARPSSVRCASSEPRPSGSFPGLDGEDGGPLSRALAVGSVSTAVALFLFTRMAGAAPDLSILAAQSMPYDAAMADSRPTMVEFYADWCEVCKEMARDVSKVEDRFKDKVNFVMINVDNPRYVEEMDEFGVDGIPHFVFLDSAKNEQGFVVGRMPRRILAENLTALASGEAQLPHSQLVGTYSMEAPPVQASLAQEAAVTQAPSVSVSADPEAAPAQEAASPPSMALAAADVATAPSQSLFDFEVENIKGNMVSLGEYKGKVSLVVNVASKCGLTDSNYKGLTQLYDKYKGQGLEILAFPCNQFLKQEPGSNEQIENFACSRYKATYPLFSKIDVNGPGTAPVYQFLKSQQGEGADISWNFEKFLVDKSGNVVKRYSPYTSPLAIEDDLRALL